MYSYVITFSNCGSFAVLVDRRPLHGSKAPNYSTMLLELTVRRQQKHMRACALYRQRTAMPKAIEWREDGVWVMGRRGLTLVDV